jgi:hypothetical protein
MNIYQYIPTLSEHAPHVFNWFVLQEICRIRLSCTSDQDFQHMNSLFANRLFARGYSNTIHSQAMTKLPTRAQLLQKLTDKVNAEPNTHDPPSKIIATFEEPLRTKEIAWKTILTMPHPNPNPNPNLNPNLSIVFHGISFVRRGASNVAMIFEGGSCVFGSAFTLSVSI